MQHLKVTVMAAVAAEFIHVLAIITNGFWIELEAIKT
jgi:hypothetical protein